MESGELNQRVAEDAGVVKQMRRIGLWVIAGLVGIWLVFSLSRYRPVSATMPPAATAFQQQRPLQSDTFQIQKGEVTLTMYNDSAIGLRICANHPYVVMDKEGSSFTDHRMPSGCWGWGHSSIAGLLQVRGLYNGTLLRMRQMPMPTRSGV